MKTESKNLAAVIALASMGVILIVVLAYYVGVSKSGQRANAEPVDSMAGHHDGNSQPPVAASSLQNLVGKKAPDFSLADKDGKIYSLENLKGKNVILFFNEGLMCYPACWNQIVALSQDERLNQDSTVALSVIVDPPKDWEKAINKMPELGKSKVVFDAGAAVSGKLGVLTTPSSMHYGSLPGHTYILIDKDGTVKHVFDDPRMAIHNDGLVAELEKLN